MKPTVEKDNRPDCPVGETQCPIIDELMMLRQLARTDPLTGLFNSRHFRDALLQEIERTQRQGQPTSLMFVDLDFFKKVNDTHGHEVGNTALKHLADLLVNNLRRLDIPCRYGGEEFVVILPGTDLYTGKFVAERIRSLIESSPVPLAKGELRLTASIGIDTYRSEDQDTPDAFVARTDALLYQAKAEGRNRVVHGVADLTTEAKISADEKAALSDLFTKR
ncbi:GGDEF domain-containing protein [Simiduia agarivorans]|uniref:diguanylate cyclase n=1 Tax=Simiduia agarivorans (strain DSM 21679 / JCM 13881 / BCRC 17597 / SA1) TaxID=1117647 RepID=K4KRG9_SIMAS|nr:GGDEF domain-containing protein [Simiduia agarivorans]AFV00734.1 response regulator receiver domain-containing protein [Simiduia agarivorans SA1 = DSM 21679]